MCMEALDGQKFQFKCPANYYISSVVAYYGQPQGSCGCPYWQQVDFKSECYGKYAAVNGTNICMPEDNDDGDSEVMPCFPALTRFGNRCCSLEHMPFSTVGNLDNLELKAYPGCNSLTATYLAEALCGGLNSCAFEVGETVTHKVSTAKIPPYGAAKEDLANICMNGDYASTGTCESTFAYNMDTTSCGQAIYTPASTAKNSASVNRLYKLMFEAICQTDVVKVGYAEVSETLDDEYIVYVAATLNAISILTFILGLTWMQFKLDNQAEKSEANKCTAGDYTVIMHTLPKGVTSVAEVKEKLSEFFAKQLTDPVLGWDKYPVPVEIADINVATGADDYLLALKQRGSAAHRVDNVMGAVQSRHRRGIWWKKAADYAESKEFTDELDKASEPLEGELRSALLEFEIANDLVQSLSGKAKKSLSKAYVTFKHEILQSRAIFKYPPIGVLNYAFQRSESKMDGQTVFLNRAPEPEEIIFENVPVPEWNRFLRFIIGTWMTVLCLGISYAMIYYAKNVSTMWSGNTDKINCAVYEVSTFKNATVDDSTTPSNTISYASVLYDQNPDYYGANTTDSAWGSFNYLKCYCAQIAYDAHQNKEKDPMAVMKAYTFYDKASDSNKRYCDEMLSGSTLAMAANYIATFVIVVVNANLAFLMSFLVDFEKHSNATSRIISMMIKLFIAQYINTAFLSLIIAGDISRAGGQNIRFGVGTGSPITFGIFTGTIQDYDVTW